MALGILSRLGAFKLPRDVVGIDRLVSILENLFQLARSDIDNRPCILNLSTAIKGTIANTLETSIFSYTLPASNLQSSGFYQFRFKAFGNKPNSHTVTFKLYLGSDVLQTVVNTSANAWNIDEIISFGVVGYATSHAVLGSVDFTSDLLFKLTAKNGTAALGDCVIYGASLELLNTPT